MAIDAGAGLWLQYAVVAMVVLASAWIVLAKQWPAAARRLRQATARGLLREGRPAWSRRLGRRLAPPATVGGGRSCGGCTDCGPRKPGA